MTVTHAGSTKKFADGWEAIFGKQSGGSKRAASGKKTRAAGAKSAKKRHVKPVKKKAKKR